MSQPAVKIRFVSPSGDGFCEDVFVPAGTTVGAFIDERVKDQSRYRITVNRGPVSRDDVLEENDMVAATLQKIDAGC